MKYCKKICFSLASFFLAILGGLLLQGSTSAISVSPMKQVVTLTPGEEYTGKVKVFVERSSAQEKQFYEASIAPLSVNDTDNNYTGVFSKLSENNEIVHWTTLSNEENTVGYGDTLTGSILRDDSIELHFTVNVPEETRGGGQYFAVMVKQVKDPNDKSEGNATIEETLGIASMVYVEVSGDLKIAGEIKDNNIPGFLLNPPIMASFVAKNEGNTHSEVKYSLQVYPIFSNEEIYTTEDDPNSDYVLPGTTRYVEQKWNEAPLVGIFRVKQTVYYDSLDSTPSITERTVIICPVWLLFIIFFVIAALIIWLVMRARARGKSQKSSKASTEARPE